MDLERHPLSKPEIWVLCDNDTGLEVEVVAQTASEAIRRYPVAFYDKHKKTASRPAIVVNPTIPGELLAYLEGKGCHAGPSPKRRRKR